ncbi:hypothetical protein BDV96DRAFT_686186 [Lophiotrema nucula]|uniref:Ubiquitin 3 binding protein But2 C-terminal domain-containing protein n=1 Tax=Lophiotrema nucula TaxID=690887 RepID=A0A6A5ZBL7_9PLEO|nr:hypothetical protein BDV96DRAFT_686186 [Lophiotrema nucula]
MQFLTIAAALASSALVSAAPKASSEPLERRACSVAYPASIGFPINYDVHQDANGANARTNIVSFNNIPAGSYGCQLEVNFPTNYPITHSGASTVSVFTLDKNGKEAGLFGTVNFVSSPVAPTKYVINSATCSNLMTYELKIASPTLAGRTAFADTKDAGITMTYNC